VNHSLHFSRSNTGSIYAAGLPSGFQTLLLRIIDTRCEDGAKVVYQIPVTS
jgi:hypothetical protein